MKLENKLGNFRIVRGKNIFSWESKNICKILDWGNIRNI